MLETEKYLEKLTNVSAMLKQHFDTITICENGTSSFFNGQKDDLEVEIYQSDNSAVIDMWKGSEEFNDEELVEEEVQNYEEAINKVIDWIYNYEK